MKATEVEIRFGFPVSNQYSDNRVSLVITDRRSGRRILEAELLAEDFTGLMATRGANVSASILTDEHYAKVGKYVVADSAKVPDDIHPRFGRTKPGEAATWWAEKFAADGNWDDYYLSQHNDGWRIHVTRYVDEPPERKW